jgi:hypothetical protein
MLRFHQGLLPFGVTIINYSPQFTSPGSHVTNQGHFIKYKNVLNEAAIMQASKKCNSHVYWSGFGSRTSKNI